MSEERVRSWRFRDWRVRTKIVAILLIPLLAVVALSGLRLARTFTDMSQTSRAEHLAGVSAQAAALADELEAERDLTGAYLGQQRGYGGAELKTERGRVDNALRTFRSGGVQSVDGGYGRVVTDLVNAIEKHAGQLDDVRDATDRGVAPWPGLFADYFDFINDLLRLEDNIPQGNSDRLLADRVRALSALSRSKALLSAQRGALDFDLGGDQFTNDQFRDFLTLDAQYQATLQDFDGSITSAQRTFYQKTVDGAPGAKTHPATDAAHMKDAAIDHGTNSRLGLPTGSQDHQIPPIQIDSWYKTTSTVIHGDRAVEAALANQVFDRAQTLHNQSQRQVALDAGIVLAVLLVTFILALLVAQSLARPLRRLRSTAIDVAHHRLPAAVARLRSTDPGSLDLEVEPVGIASADEVGEVASAFDSVHREAVRVAAEQALLRKNVSTMFVNLSRRTQSLVERQLKLIDDLEVNEDDSAALGNLFQLDHLATRMRRNAENLLVLAGGESGRRWQNPIVLIDVLRAAAAEVEQYPRIAQTYVTTREVEGRAALDLIHLVAELLENALEFSAPDTQVVVSARSLSGDAGVMVEIEDRGIGMSAEELATANERLATSAEIDVSLSRMMGLYVVGKLATRHGIRVQLRQSPTGGVLAQIHLPANIVAEPTGVVDEMDQYVMSSAQFPPAPESIAALGGASPVPVAAPPAQAGGHVDLGHHETRPIIVDPQRPRAWRGTRGDDGQPQRHPGGDGPETGGPGGFGGYGGDQDGPGTGQYAPLGDQNAAPPHGQPPQGPAAQGSTGTYPDLLAGFDDMSGPAAPPAPPAPATAYSGPLGPPAPERHEQPPSDFAGPTDEPGYQGSGPHDVGTGSFDPGMLQPEFGGRNGSGPHDAPFANGAANHDARSVQAGMGADSEGAAVTGAYEAPERPGAEPPASTSGSYESPESGTGTFDAGPEAVPIDEAATAEGGGEEFLPIYAQVESEWFRRRTKTPTQVNGSANGSAAPGDQGVTTPAGGTPAVASAPPPSWQSPADAGWQAAEQLAKPRSSGTTKAGLPVRVPRANYVPGSVVPGGRPGGPNGGPPPRLPSRTGQQPAPRDGSPPVPQQAGQAGPAGPAAPPQATPPARSPEAVRGLLSTYHRGLRQGREAGRQQGAGDDAFESE